MKDYKDKSKCLASLAVFRGLYNKKNDVYGVISEFLKEVIIVNSKYQFGLSEITELLNSSFDFNIPKAIVQTSLKRLDFVEKNKGQYVASNLSNVSKTTINSDKDKIETNNNQLIEGLFRYIEGKQGTSLTQESKEKIICSFCSFMLEDSNGHDYSEFISGYIIENKSNIDFTSQLNLIKEGIVLYSGIRYNTNINNLGSWTTPLTIYIETEILFHLAGYNGEIFRTLFDDFFGFVKEINSKGNKKLIELKYFVEVKDEIEKFFNKAEYIVEGKDKANPAVTAMKIITEGCESPADVVMKKTKFYEMLKASGIHEDTYSDYFAPKNHQYNIINQDILDKISRDLEINNDRDNLKFLNYISIHRKKEADNNFENIKYILLSGNSNTLKIAWHDEIKEQGNVPLATNLSFLTNKFWFKLNKGFGNNNFPTTFDIVTKAQIILSSLVNKSVNTKYEELQADFDDGKITEKDAALTIANLRNLARKPEDILSDDVCSILDSISEETIYKHLEEQELFKSRAIKEAEENVRLKQDIKLKEEAIRVESQAKSDKENEIIQNKYQHLKDMLTEKEQSYNQMIKQKKPIDAEIKKSFNMLKILIGTLFILYIICTDYLICKMSWNIMEQWTYIINACIPIIISFIYFLIKEKTLNPSEYLQNTKQTIKMRTYAKFNFDLNRLDELGKDIMNLKKEIHQ